MDDLRAIRPVWAELDLDALASNLRAIRERAGPDKKIIASIKADAYGHGAVDVACALARFGVDMLATGSFQEAVDIRGAGVDTPILMFGACEPEGIPALLEHDLIPTIYDDRLARAAAQAGFQRAPVFVKVDCGFGRLGVPYESAKAFVQRIEELPNIELAGLYTHVPFSDEAGRDWAASRTRAFAELIEVLAAEGIEIPVTQAVASASLITDIPDACNAICPGHALYGLAAVQASLQTGPQLRPVLRAIKTRLIHVYRTSQGRTFGMGGKHTASPGTVIGVVPLGLTDGYRAALDGQQAWMLCRGERVPVLGVSLEHTSVDLTKAGAVRVGDELTVVGADGDDGITVEELASWRGTSPLEVVMSFSRRIPRLPS